MVSFDPAVVVKSESFASWLGIKPGEDVNFELLGHGEYNLNYIFRRPGLGDKLVLRIPMGSQMHLRNQAGYEFEALRLLEPSGRTPVPLYLDDARTAEAPHGFMVMSFLPGRALRYESDLGQAAECLAEIHSMEVPEKSRLLAPRNPLAAVLEECIAMSARYLESSFAKPEVAKFIRALLGRGQKIVASAKSGGERCLVNTELNSGNFLVNDGKTYLVDWEKPIISCPGQDLGHFLAPTTTLWKTESILTEAEIQSFIKGYCAASCRFKNPEAVWEKTKPYLAMTCLRGITWCSMAWVEYQNPERPLKDAFTYEKIQHYLTPQFLEMIWKDYLSE